MKKLHSPKRWIYSSSFFFNRAFYKKSVQLSVVYFLYQHQNVNALFNCCCIFFCAFKALDGSYTGFIKVHLRLSRPVTVPAVEAEGQEGKGCGQSEKRTSFYLPCDCVKQLHISSLTTTREVIQGLLKKFMVLDNPRKFALYRQTHRHGQGEENTPNY